MAQLVKMSQNRQQIRVHYAKKYASSKKSTPLPGVAVVTISNMSYVIDINMT